jgi:hypothetical protein
MGLAGNGRSTFVGDLAWPRGNVTGVSGVGAEVASKSVELTPEMLPSAYRVVALGNAPDPFLQALFENISGGRMRTPTAC